MWHLNRRYGGGAKRGRLHGDSDAERSRLRDGMMASLEQNANVQQNMKQVMTMAMSMTMILTATMTMSVVVAMTMTDVVCVVCVCRVLFCVFCVLVMRPKYADIFHGAPETQPLVLFIYACMFPNYPPTRMYS